MSKELASITFEIPLVYKGSFGARDAGTHESTMMLYSTDAKDYLFIEWDIPGLDDVEHIGLWFEGKELIDYDGISGYLPKQAIKLLEDLGYAVGPDFRPEGTPH